jgi:aquaporin Z
MLAPATVEETEMASTDDLGRKALAELIGTFWLVLGGCGTAVMVGGWAAPGVGLLCASLAFGLSVLTMAYAIGNISGCHLNPAVTVGLWAAGRFPLRAIPVYVVAQLVGAFLAATLILIVASGAPGFDLAKDGLAQNGYGGASPAYYSLQAAWVAETVLTAMFLFVILGATDRRAPPGLAPLAIGLTLTLIHLVSVPITNTSVNPARSTGPALLVGRAALDQLWLFWVAPLTGAVIGALIYRYLLDAPDEPSALSGE